MSIVSKRELLDDKLLDSVVGGSVTYAEAQPGSKNGKIGINGNYTHTYDDIDKVTAYIGAHYKDKEWTSASERDNYLMNGLIAAGLIH